MHVAAATSLSTRLLPALARLQVTSGFGVVAVLNLVYSGLDPLLLMLR